MPHYYFDVHDSQGVHRDDVGLVFADMRAAITEARRALADMTRESLLIDDSPSLSIVIRDGEEGPVALHVSMTTEWLDGTD